MSEQLYYLYILVAVSTGGKGVLMNQIRSEGLWKSASKYSTRDHRDADDDVVKITDEAVLDVERNGLDHEVRLARMRYINDVCGDGKGVVYYKNDYIYGVEIDEIIEGLESSNIVVVISDFHVIAELRAQENLKNRIKVMYLASTIDEREILRRYKNRESTDFDKQSNETILVINKIEQMCSILSSAARLQYLTKIEEVLPLLNEQWNNYVPYFDTIKTRSLNIRMLYNRYIDNIKDIDYVLLNFYDLEYLFSQARNIIKSVQPKRKVLNPPVFMVCSALSSGKATLMEIIGDLGTIKNNIVITPKFAKRDARDTDGRDGMTAIGVSGSFNSYISDSKDVWKWNFHSSGTEYAIDHSVIRENIGNRRAQIFISNMAQIETARKIYPDNIVVLYLHATHETATKQHIKEKRKFELWREISKEMCANSDSLTDEDEKYIFENDKDIQCKLETLITSDLREINEVHQDYLKYNYLIDHVLLNTGTREDLVEQMINLISYYTS